MAIALGSDFNPNAYCMSMVSTTCRAIINTDHTSLAPPLPGDGDAPGLCPHAHDNA